MKPSGIEWIGDIPDSWNISRIKYHFIINNGYSFESSKYVDDGIRVIRISDVEDDSLYDEEKRFYPISYLNLIGNALLKPNDILITLTGNLGRCYKVKETDGILGLNQRVGCIRAITNAYNLDYFKRVLQCQKLRKEMELSANGSAQLNMSTEWLKNVSLPLPTLEVQQSIAKFLDEKCFEIDMLYSQIQDQIVILENYKKSVITEAVTKGLNRDVKMKDTKFQYWAQIPENWELKDVKYVFEIVKRIAGKEGYDVLSVTQKGLKVKDLSNNEGQLANDYSNYQFVYPTDYVMNHMDLLTGWVDCSTMFGVTSPDYRVFRLRNKSEHNLDYFKFVLQSCYFNRIFYSLGAGVSNLGRWRLQTESFNNFLFPIPSKEEQDEIAEFLNKQCLEIDGIITDKQAQLETLAEYKKSLIYEYVTGKKQVKENA